MIKKIILNIILFIIIYVIPLFILHQHQDDLGDIVYVIQNYVFIIIFFGSILFIYLNNKYRKQTSNLKWIWILFEVIGIIGLCGSGFVLFLIFGLRNCCGF